jgi:arabinogalactan endo-1,4-beta-galactosidase
MNLLLHLFDYQSTRNLMKIPPALSIALLLMNCGKPNPDENLPAIYLGADLSYVNEVEDCGATFREIGVQKDPYLIFSEKGCNLVRVRLWHNPDWTDYSDFEDVKKTIQRAKDANMQVLLDFHYSDTWADPGKQIIPAAWREAETVEDLGDSVYNYTIKIIRLLHGENLTPEFVQVGNETNSEILMPEEVQDGAVIRWERNAYLLNRGLKAVRDVSDEIGKPIQSFLHIAQPENAIWWFAEAKNAGVTDFDWIGLSYYPKWSSYSINNLASAIAQLKATYGKRIMIVETSYPYTLTDIDQANNILGQDALIPGYPATPEGQRRYMIDLTKQAIKGGAEGVIYWEPAWVTSGCSTLWGQGSHWDNATFFDAANSHEALPAFDFYSRNHYK